MEVKIDGLESVIERIVDERLSALATKADDPWLTSEQAAKYLNLARSTIHDLVSEGKLPRHGGRKTRIMLRRSDLDAYVAARGKL
jgi:excisionase family DNA binding protein